MVPLAVLFLWSVDTRRWNDEHPYDDAVLCLMFPVLPLLQAKQPRVNSVSKFYSALAVICYCSLSHPDCQQQPCYSYSPSEKVEMLEEGLFI
jgi:hypothetical protein